MRKQFRKIVSTVLVGTMLFFAPSMIPIRAVKPAMAANCGVIILDALPLDTAFAAPAITPCPVGGGGHTTPVWPWVVIGCAGSIVVSALAANFFQNRQLTTPEAWTCGLLYWWYPSAYPQQQPASNKHH
jgi:hypothetical protein